MALPPALVWGLCFGWDTLVLISMDTLVLISMDTLLLISLPRFLGWSVQRVFDKCEAMSLSPQLHQLCCPGPLGIRSLMFSVSGHGGLGRGPAVLG